MTEGVTVSANWMVGGNARTLADLSSAIAARVKYMHFQTTEMAVKATAINCMTSLRAETAVAPKKNPQVIDSRWKIDIVATQYKPGWAHPPRSAKHGRRVIRMPGGKALDAGPNQNRVVNLAGHYRGQMGESVLKVYAVTICELPNTKPFYNSLIIAESKDALWPFIRKRIERRIGQYSGVSKKLLGLAMHKVASNKGNAAKDALDRLALDYAVVTMSGEGFNNGTFMVNFVDDLPFSAQSLKHGPMGVALALRKAANRCLAIVEKAAGYPIDKPNPPMFEEYARGGAA
jgi:hypothetical protein